MATLSPFSNAFMDPMFFRNSSAHDQFFREWSLASPLSRSLRVSPAFGSCSVTETKEGRVIEIDAPNMVASDLKIEVTDDSKLTISGEHTSEQEETTAGKRCYESSSSKFKRTFLLPKDADASMIAATVDNGVIRVTIPRHAELPARATSIPIARSA